MRRLTAIGMAFVLCAIALRAQAPQGRGGGRGDAALPDGPGRDLVQAMCSRCHATALIVNSGGYTRQGWEELFGTMIAVPAEQRAAIADYLAKNFPEQPRPKPVVVPGAMTVSFKEWSLPTLGSRPHDPLAASDG